MRYILTFYCLLYSAVLFAQVDTIHTGREKIACTVKEVTPEAVLYFYSGETVTNSLYKNTVQKIVFRSGRVQTFSESYILVKIEDIADFGKVTITQVEGEIKGLLKVGQVSAFSRGGSIFSNVDRVKERALNKLKMEAVMRGANLIYITYEKTEGNQYGGYFQAPEAAKTIYSGVVYSKSVLGNYVWLIFKSVVA